MDGRKGGREGGREGDVPGSSCGIVVGETSMAGGGREGRGMCVVCLSSLPPSLPPSFG